MSTESPTVVGGADRPRTRAFSIITTSSPIQISHPRRKTAVQQLGTLASVTAPQSTADGARMRIPGYRPLSTMVRIMAAAYSAMC
jgi:hypothetical protein